MFNFRFFFLEKMVADLDRIQRLPDADAKLTISDRIMLTVALKQVARRCVRDTEASSALERAHICLQKIWLAAPPMRWLGFFTRERSDFAAVTVDFKASSGFSNDFRNFRLHLLSALIPPDVRNAFAGPTASKASNPHVDLTGIASAEAAAGGPTLEALTQALLMCDRLEEVLSCSRRSKRLICGVVESLVFEGRGLWTSDLSTAPGDTLRVLHRLAAHYLAAVKSSPLGRSSGATAVLVMASLLELFEITSKSSTGGGVFSRIIGKSGSAPLWSLQPWEKPDGRPASFADLTAWLPMVSPAQCEVRSRICQRHATEGGSIKDVSHGRLYTSLQDSSLLFGPPEGEDSEMSGVGKHILLFVRQLRSGMSGSTAGSTTFPSVLPAIDRPYQDWELDLAWSFDPTFLAECPEWRLALDLAVYYQMTLASVPSLTSALEGSGTAPADHILSAQEAEIHYTISLFNPPTKLTVQVQHVCTLVQRHPNKLYLQPSLTHPKLLCSSLPYLRFGGTMENEIISAPILPDFDFSLTQQQAESLLSILNCPGLRIPLLLEFLVPNHISLLHHRQFQRVFFCCLFEPGAYGDSQTFLAKDWKIPAVETLSVELGWLHEELTKSPHLMLPSLNQLFEAMKDLGSGSFDGPLVQPFLFVVHVALLLQDFMAHAKEKSINTKALECLEEHQKLFRRFTQKFARKVLARWIRQANSAKAYDVLMQCHAHLAMTTWPKKHQMEDDDTQSLAVASCTFSLWSEKIGDLSSVEHPGDQADMIHLVFSTLSRHRVLLLKSVEEEDETERNKYFSFI